MTKATEEPLTAKASCSKVLPEIKNKRFAQVGEGKQCKMDRA